jgi:uncharacterized protein
MGETKLSREDRLALLQIARQTLQHCAEHGRLKGTRLEPPTREALQARCGAFVTLHKQGELRGCIGSFHGEGHLCHTIESMAYAAGWQDPRFSPLGADELDQLEIEISVLSPLRKITDVSEIEVGRHGICISQGRHRGVLLPQVATEYGWDRETFLAHTCRKAGLPTDAWKQGATIEIFSAEIFGEKDPA